MSLKVLLADESSTIKKVFQLALQDFAVEVTAVHSGADVLTVLNKVQPNIIFVDVLLQKKSGYDVCGEIKSHMQKNNIPVILMWSSFLNLDEDKFQACGADSHIEKPFEIQTLRELVNQFVPKTSEHMLANFLQLPEDETEQPDEAANVNQSATSELSTNPLLEVIDQFEEVNLDVKLPSIQPDLNSQNSLTNDEEDANTIWVSKNLSSPSTNPNLSPDLDFPDDDTTFDSIKTKIDTVVNQQINFAKLAHPDETPVLVIEEQDQTTNSSISTFDDNSSQTNINLSPDEINQLVLEQAKPLIAEAIWKIVPDLAKQMIEVELKRLLTQKDDIGTY